MNSLNLRQIDGGNVIKQADFGSNLSFELLDEHRRKIPELDGQIATIRLIKGDNIAYQIESQVVDGSVSFKFDRVLEKGIYVLEIVAGNYVFPSNNMAKITIEKTAGNYKPENMVKTDLVELQGKITAIEQREHDVNQELLDVGQKQAKMNDRLDALESKEDKDTIYDDTEIKRRVSALEERPSSEPYDDTELSNRVTALERKQDNDTIYDDSEIKRRITALEQKEDHDTIYNDTEIKQSIANVDNKVSGLSEKVTALEERPIVDTALTKRVEALEKKEDKDTVYNDTEIKNRLVALEQKEDKDTVYDDSAIVKRIESLEAREDKDTVYDDTAIKERISVLEDKPDNDTIYDDSNLKAQIAELESKLQSLNTVRRAPTGYTLDRTTTPWTVWFDNGCGLQMPDYSPKDEQVQNSTIYGFGFSLNIMNTTVGTYPVPQNFIAASMGHISLNNFSKQDANAFIYFSPSTKVINPVRNDAENFDWSHCYGEVNEDNNAYKRKHVFPRICYELGIWSEEDVLYLGATKK